MKKILAIGIGLFGYLILNIQLDISYADQYYFANNKGGLIPTKVNVTIDLKEEKSIWNEIRDDTNAENESFFTEPCMPIIIGFGIIIH
jgi:hypothetical protein